jgi:Xaa-Pro aminopeptidase
VEIEEMLEQIFRIVTEIMPLSSNSLQPGISDERIRAKIAALPFDLPDSFYRLYKWRNGSNLYEDCFFPFYTFIPIEEAVTVYFEFREGEFAKWTNWRPSWFPFLRFDTKEWLFLDIDNNAIRRYFVEIGVKRTALMYDNLEDMIFKYLDAYQRKVFYVNDYGYLNYNEDDSFFD